jgi:hypothetical protein
MSTSGERTIQNMHVQIYTVYWWALMPGRCRKMQRSGREIIVIVNFKIGEL